MRSKKELIKERFDNCVSYLKNELKHKTIQSNLLQKELSNMQSQLKEEKNAFDSTLGMIIFSGQNKIKEKRKPHYFSSTNLKMNEHKSISLKGKVQK